MLKNTNKHVKRHVRLSVTRETQLKTTRHHAAPTGVAEIKQTDTGSVGRRGALRALQTVGTWDAGAPLEKSLAHP